MEQSSSTLSLHSTCSSVRTQSLHVINNSFFFFAGLTIVCDDYFVPSLTRVSDALCLSSDVAGATLMAAGSSAPELATSVIAVFVSRVNISKINCQQTLLSLTSSLKFISTTRSVEQNWFSWMMYKIISTSLNIWYLIHKLNFWSFLKLLFNWWRYKIPQMQNIPI